LLPLLTKERVGVRFYKAFYESEMLPDSKPKLKNGITAGILVNKKNSELRSQKTDMNSGRLGNEYWFKTLPLVGKKK
jgi:hypothetical protein